MARHGGAGQGKAGMAGQGEDRRGMAGIFLMLKNDCLLLINHCRIFINKKAKQPEPT